MREFFVGTSGWNYPDFDGIIYKTNENKLIQYSRIFDTVEINASFYRIFKKSVFENWKKITPQNFTFTAKLSKLFTHRGGLKFDNNLLDWFFGNIKGLGKKLKVILVQLPPKLVYKEDEFKKFSDAILKYSSYKIAIEPRHPSWFVQNFFKQIEKRNIALCIADTGGKYPTSFKATADFTYFRLHGPGKLYASNYTTKGLQKWAEKVKNFKKTENYIYFDNTMNGYAAKNAIAFKKLLNA